MAKSSRGTRASLSKGRSKVARRGRGGPNLSRTKGRGGVMTFGHSGTPTPYGPGTPSVKRRVVDALRRKGMSKTKAARIANAVARGTNGHGRRGPHQK